MKITIVAILVIVVLLLSTIAWLATRDADMPTTEPQSAILIDDQREKEGIERQARTAQALERLHQLEAQAEAFSNAGEFDHAIAKYQQMLDLIASTTDSDNRINQYISKASAGRKLAESTRDAALEAARSAEDRRKREEEERQRAAEASNVKESVRPDPVTTFKMFADQFVTAINQAKPVVGTNSAGTAHFSLVVTDYSVDLRRTASLVSPVIGIVHFSAPVRRDKDILRANWFRFTFPRQNEKWVLSGIEWSWDGRKWYSEERNQPVYLQSLITQAYLAVPQ